MRTPHRLIAAGLGVAVVAAVVGGAVLPLGAAARGGPAGATSTPPPTPVPPKSSPSPYPTALVTPTPAPAPPPVTARAAVLEDAATGQILYQKKADQRDPIASITKIMTALIALRRSKLSADVSVSDRAAAQPGSGMDLKPGEEISVRNLLYGMLLSSANDAAVAVAEHVAGTTAKFVTLMNRKAGTMHLTRTRFASPSGLNDKGFSTALDLATLTRNAFRSRAFAGFVSTKTADIPSPSGKIRHLQNRNALLWLYSGAIGVKTGFTEEAGWCLVAAARRGHRRLVAVVLGSATQDRSFFEAATLLNYGFLEFKRTTLVTPGQPMGSVSVEGVSVPAYATEGSILLVRRDLVGNVSTRLVAGPDVLLPVTAAQPVGRAILVAGRRGIGSVQIAAQRAVAAPLVPPKSTRTWTSAYEDVWNLVAGLVRATVGTFL